MALNLGARSKQAVDPMGFQYASAIHCQAPAQTRPYLVSQAASRYILPNLGEVNLVTDGHIDSLQNAGRRFSSELNASRSATWQLSMGLLYSYSAYRQNKECVRNCWSTSQRLT
jgi:hypothetical protein